MPGPDVAWERLLGRPPTDAERQALFRLRDALELSPNDALWQVLIALEYHLRLYERVPGDIEKAAKAAIDQVEASAAAAAKTAAADSHRELCKAVAKTSVQAARAATGAQLLRAGAVALVAAAVLVFGTGWWSYRRGAAEAGGGAGEDPRSAWAHSPEGQLAYELARAGSLRLVARCEAAGWEVRDGMCFPQPLRDQVTGWRIPPKVPRDRSQ